MDDSSAMATGMVGVDKSGETSSEITQQVINIDQATLTSVNGEITAIGEEISSVGDHTSTGLPLLKATTSHKTTDMTTQATIASPMDTTVEAPLLTTTAVTAEISTKDTNLQSTTCVDGATVQEKISPSLSTTHNVTVATANAGSSLMTPPANTAVSTSAELTSTASSVPKLEPSTLGQVKFEPQDFENITFPKRVLPVTGASGYNSSKVAAEMAKIDSFLASLAKGGTGSSTMPNIKVKTESAGVIKPAPIGSALGNIALSYGYSEEESSSSSSDESDDDKPANVRSTKVTAAAATVAMDTREVEQSMKKVAVSSDSSSSSSEDELGVAEVKKPHFTPRTKSEILPQDLPPVPPIDVVLSEDSTLEKIGSVHSIVEQIVVVAHKSTFQVVNIDTIFWLEDRSPLGKVFEVFGPVVSPYYSIRINQTEDTRVYGVGSTVYFASNDSTLTYYVFPDRMDNQKGSDASWLNDEEPPSQFLEYSDDDEEAMAKRDFRKHSRSSPNDGQKKLKQFQKEKNVVKHVDSSSVIQNRNNSTYYSGTMNQQGGHPICSIPQSFHGSTSFQGYHSMYTPPVNPSTVQNDFRGPFPVPVLSTVPSTLRYPPVCPPPQVLAQPSPVVSHHPPGIPFHHTSHNCYPPSSSSGLLPPPSAQFQPPPTMRVAELPQNYSYT